MKVLGMIPARYASTRMPGKPLAPILGKSMIQRVFVFHVPTGKSTPVTDGMSEVGEPVFDRIDAGGYDPSNLPEEFDVEPW